jgi:hypothetical protein
VSTQTPNNAEFSIAAKVYVCAGRVLPPGGMMLGWTSPTGERVTGKVACEAALAAEFDWLQTNNYITATAAKVKQLIGSYDTYTVRANYSSAPGIGGAMLEATGWQDTTFVEIVRHLIGQMSDDPTGLLLRRLSQEFRDAGVLHGDAWNKEWLDYLVVQWGRGLGHRPAGAGAP